VIDSVVDTGIDASTEAAVADATTTHDTASATLADAIHVDSESATDSGTPSPDAAIANAPDHNGCSCSINTRVSSNAPFLLLLLALAGVRRVSRKSSC
jgi:hypothetical protein